MGYQCNYCQVAFNEPTIVSYTEHLGEGVTRTYKEERCPVCGCNSFEEVDECIQCGRPTPLGEILCKRCKRGLKKKIINFFDYMTAEEEEQFDIWMDGDSIVNRRKWT
jgi:hypothetical protein